MMNRLLFEIFPYVALSIFVFGMAARFARSRFTITSLSSQLLESRKLFWGSVTWHYGIVVVLAGHLLLFLWPGLLDVVSIHENGLPVFEGIALAFGLCAVFGGVVLAARRAVNDRLRSVTSVMDMVVLALLLLQCLAGVAIAYQYRWGSVWYAGSMTPYLRSLLVLKPDAGYLATMPWLVRFHVADAFLILALIPLTRLIHALPVPFRYLMRSAQVVVWNR